MDRVSTQNRHHKQCPACRGALPVLGHGITRINTWLDPLSILPASINHTDLGMEPAVFEGFMRSFGIDTADKVTTLVRTYNLVQRHLAPFVLKIVIDMIPNLVRAVTENPKTKIVFLGRDGFIFGFVLAELLPNLFALHGVSMYLPRPLVNDALHDMEVYENKHFSQIEMFRKRPRVPADPAGALQRLTTYFEQCGVRVEASGLDVCVVDSGLKGSIQEMLAAAYPDVDFSGHYAFFAASPHDPHPGTKRGYMLHLDGNHGGGLALRAGLPEDPALTFLHHQAIVAIEGLISGSKNSPTTFNRSGRPRAQRRRHDDSAIHGINPVLIAPEYTDPLVREAILAMNIVAIIHYTRTLLPTVTMAGLNWYDDASDTPWYAELVQRSDVFRDQIRAWVGRSPNTDPEIARVLDAFIPRDL